jgi:hypothetical protein
MVETRSKGQIPVESHRVSVLPLLASMDRWYWVRAAFIAAASAVVIAVPTRLIPNGFFTRMTPTRPQDYAFLFVSSALVGLTFAARPSTGGAERSALTGGVGTYLAVGCPICNKVVVALLGASGAMSYFAPIQPILGVGAVALLFVALRRRLRAVNAESCPVPASPLA